ncbi:hypothetical protein LTR10_015433 [Elasticomyces elasticus]|nr:hypothetical protein LTR10_015433 [Elasticomyces elasticus]
MNEHDLPIPADLKEAAKVSEHTEIAKVEVLGTAGLPRIRFEGIGGEKIERDPAFDTLFIREGLKTRTKTLYTDL